MRGIGLAVATALLVLAPLAQADEVGGSGFSVPQDEWLWGIEGLVRTPVDLSVDVGVAFSGFEVDGEAKNLDDDGLVEADQILDIDPIAVSGGFRIAGGIGYWSCCVLIEPALAFRYQSYRGGDRTDDTPGAYEQDFGGREGPKSVLEIQDGWELALGPQITFIVRDTTPLLGSHLGLEGLPLVFFPFLGVAQTNWEVEVTIFDDDGIAFLDRNLEDEAFMVGFDLDIPLPGSHADFTHAFVFGFRWFESDDKHDIGPFHLDTENFGGGIPSGASCAPGGGFGPDIGCANFRDIESWRIGLYYRVTWNDFEGFVKRNLFGPVN